MIFTSLNSIFFIWIIVLTKFGEIHTNPQPNILSMLSDSIASSSRFFTKSVEGILDMSNSIVSPLCSKRTVIENFYFEFMVKVN